MFLQLDKGILPKSRVTHRIVGPKSCSLSEMFLQLKVQ